MPGGHRLLKSPVLAGIRSRLRFGRKARFAISVVLLGILIYYVDLGGTAEVLGRANPWPIVACAAIIFGERLLVTYRWHLLVRATDSQVGFLPLLRLMFVSCFLGFFAPGTVGIELFRIYGLARYTNLGLAVASVFVERLSAIYTLIGMVFLGLAFTDIVELPRAISLLVAAAFVVATLACIGLSMPRIREFPLRLLRGPTLEPLHRHIIVLYERLDDYRGRPKLLAWLVVLSIGLQISRVLQSIVLAYALGIDVPYAYFFVVVPIGIFLWILPISIQGLGVREGAYVVLLGFVGVGAAAALTLSLLNFILAVVVISLPGAVFYALGGIAEQLPADHDRNGASVPEARISSTERG